MQANKSSSFKRRDFPGRGGPTWVAAASEPTILPIEDMRGSHHAKPITYEPLGARVNDLNVRRKWLNSSRQRTALLNLSQAIFGQD